MNERGKLYTPNEAKEYYGQIVPAYRTAFAGEPWFEVSTCEDEMTPKRCSSGFSPQQIGGKCNICEKVLKVQAYDGNGLIDRFEETAKTYKSVWYLEKVNGEVALAAFSFLADAKIIAEKKYPESQDMAEWLNTRFSESSFIWLDDIFANRNIRPTGNLRSFKIFCNKIGSELDSSVIAFRTINNMLINAVRRDFGEDCRILTRERDVPDRREFVILNLKRK